MASSIKKVRCAIYTRKSTEEGLDQEFNSLDAQFEACAAYVQSQEHEGWHLSKNRYDDGGISGGTMERPALQRLLIDIDEGRVDHIIVYKIDRLTRSLSDFTKIVERLDAVGASFVSVTQSFNTATSMGRLTLNMLLSFAQFEREVTGERIRDKIAASKAKGMWMGGSVPLGYDLNPDPNTKGLVVCEAEATSVKKIFEIYQERGNLNALEAEAKRLGIIGKSRRGKPAGPLSRGALHKILTNPFYLGQINHKGTLYEGRHQALIEKSQWDDVQTKLKAASVKARGQGHLSLTAQPLKGKIFDETGDPLTPSHSNKKGRIHRYYISNRLLKAADPKGWRIPAKTIEQALASYLKQEAQALSRHIGQHAKADLDHQDFMVQAIEQIKNASDLSILGLIDRVDLSLEIAHIKISSRRLKEMLNPKSQPQLPLPIKEASSSLLLNAPLQVKRRGVERKLIIGEILPSPDHTLINLLKNAHRYLAQLKAGKSLSDIAADEGKSNTLIRTRIPLALLSPKIQKAILDGIQPLNLTADCILKSSIPISWTDQERRYGFD